MLWVCVLAGSILVMYLMMKDTMAEYLGDNMKVWVCLAWRNLKRNLTCPLDPAQFHKHPCGDQQLPHDHHMQHQPRQQDLEEAHAQRHPQHLSGTERGMAMHAELAKLTTNLFLQKLYFSTGITAL